jgi:hypothetical protein
VSVKVGPGTGHVTVKAHVAALPRTQEGVLRVTFEDRVVDERASGGLAVIEIDEPAGGEYLFTFLPDVALKTTVTFEIKAV